MEPADIQKRPFGVTAIIVLQLISLASIIGDVAGFPVSQLPSLLPIQWKDNTNYVFAMGIAIAVLQIAIIIGLWGLQRWAWFLIMIQLGVSMAIGLVSYFNGLQLYSYMLLNVIMVFYLNQRDVQIAFGHKPKLQDVT